MCIWIALKNPTTRCVGVDSLLFFFCRVLFVDGLWHWAREKWGLCPSSVGESHLHTQSSFVRRVVCLSTFFFLMCLFWYSVDVVACANFSPFYFSVVMINIYKALAVYRSRKNVICDVFMRRVSSWALAGERAEQTTRKTNELAMMFYIIRGKILIAFHFMPRIFDSLRFIYHSTRHCRNDELCLFFLRLTD